jgi:hypothetical protein
MHTSRLYRLPALLLIVALVAVGCDSFDSGTSPIAASSGDAAATVSFDTDNISLTEESGIVTIPVTITNPPNDTVAVEVLYADGPSQTTPADFGLENSRNVGSGYVAGRVVFPDTATTGNTQAITLNIADDEPNEDQEDGVFVFQNVTNATVGATNRLTVAIGAIEIFFKDFSSEALGALSVVDVTNGNGWGLTSFSGNFYAEANAFGGAEASDSWLLLPAFNFNAFEGETLTFRNAKNFDDGGVERGLQVKVSTNYDGSGNPQDFTWIDVSDQVQSYSEGGYEYVPSGEIDLSGSQFQGDSVYVAFRYISSGTGPGSSELWQVDDIRLVGR